MDVNRLIVFGSPFSADRCELDFSPQDTERHFTQLMGKGEAAARRELMELHGHAVTVDV